MMQHSLVAYVVTISTKQSETAVHPQKQALFCSAQLTEACKPLGKPVGLVGFHKAVQSDSASFHGHPHVPHRLCSIGVCEHDGVGQDGGIGGMLNMQCKVSVADAPIMICDLQETLLCMYIQRCTALSRFGSACCVSRQTDT